jgi:carbamate kinase
LLILATDADGVYDNWGSDGEELIKRATPEEMSGREFEAGSMGPKVEAACDFVARTGERAVIGSLSEISGMVEGTSGTQFVIE